jgi:hypothetical protein
VNGENLENLTRVLQASISPVALISGVGLLILSLSNRLGRVMDRLRHVLDQRRTAAASEQHLDKQVPVLHRRARILRSSITAAIICVLLASVLVLLLFTAAVTGARLELLSLAVFAASLLALVYSLVLFVWDMNLSLKAVQEELLR